MASNPFTQKKIFLVISLCLAARLAPASQLVDTDASGADNNQPPIYLAGGTVESAPTEAPAATPPAPEAPQPSIVAPYKKHGYVEFDLNHSNLSEKNLSNNGLGYPSWNGATIQGAIQTDPKNIWSGLVNYQQEFNDSGTQVSLGNIHYFNDTVFTNLNVGTSSSGFFLPRERVEGAISKRFLPGKNLIGTLDAGYNNGRIGIRDRWVQLSGQYFVPQKPWNFELGARYNNSSPGSISSNQQYIAATYGTYKKQFLTLRYNWGTEGYQVGVPSTTGTEFISNKFSSHYVGLTWRKWVTHNNGFTATIEQYSNPYFNRTGVLIGAFHDFGT